MNNDNLKSALLLEFGKMLFPNMFKHATRQRSVRPHNGFTKNHGQGQSKARRRMAAKSRRINRGAK